jgi:hypothetical protein
MKKLYTTLIQYVLIFKINYIKEIYFLTKGDKQKKMLFTTLLMVMFSFNIFSQSTAISDLVLDDGSPDGLAIADGGTVEVPYFSSVSLKCSVAVYPSDQVHLANS